MIDTLSPRQAAMLAYIKAYIGDNGWDPTLRQIMAACGITSTSVAAYNLDRLERAGYIVTGGGARMIRLREAA